MGLSKEDKLKVEDLLYGLLLVSGNDAAVALAEYIGGSTEEFSNLMNQKAMNLGLESTHFVSPHGLDHEEHYTTAYELALITDYALQNDVFCKIVKTKSYNVNINDYAKQINNTNELLGYFDGIYGVKTGFTNGANRCLVTACKRGDLDIICVVLGCDTKKDRTTDSKQLINYALENFVLIDTKQMILEEFNNWRLSNSDNVNILKGKTQYLEFYIKDNEFPFSKMAVNKSKKNNINIDISYDLNYEAPMTIDTKIGEIELVIDNSHIYTVNILNYNRVERKNIIDYLHYIYSNWKLWLFY